MAYESGWMTQENFPEALDHFLKQMGASTESRQLLIFDNQGSHTTSEVVKMASHHRHAPGTLHSSDATSRCVRDVLVQDVLRLGS